MSQQNSSENFNDNAFNNLYEIYFKPEIELRKEKGLIPDDFELIAAQALLFPDETPSIVRLNDEIVATVKIKDGVDKSAPDYYPNCEDVETIEISEDEYKNCGHIIMIRFENCYLLKFDFVYNKRFCTLLLNNANQFLETAKFALERGHKNAYIDNAFSAFELLAKANMLLEANREIGFKTNHKAVHTRFNERYRVSKSEDELELRRLFNKLSRERYNARYLENNVSITEEDLNLSFDKIEKFHSELNQRLKRFMV